MLRPIHDTINENTQYFKDGYYTTQSGQQVKIGEQIQSCIENTKFYPPDYEFDIPPSLNLNPIFEVTPETTNAALKRLVVTMKAGPSVGLNFANGIEPGGGYLRGAMAQEEMICRGSGLFPSIVSQQQFYRTNADFRNEKATDALIFSPNVPIFRDDKENLIEIPFPAAFITSPACCLIYADDVSDVPAIMHQRIRKIVQCAIENKYRNIVLGAFGCGAFRNDPEIICEKFRIVLMDEGYAQYFDHIIFAVYCRRDTTNFDIYNKVFGQ